MALRKQLGGNKVTAILETFDLEVTINLSSV